MKPRVIAALALLAAAGCSDDPSPLAPTGAAAFLPCVFGAGTGLEVGEVLQFSGADAEREILCLEGGGEYTLVPFYAARSGTARLRVSALGGNVEAVTEPSLSLSRDPGAHHTRTPEEVAASDALHLGLRERMRREVEALRREGAAGPRASLAPAAAARAVPAVGEVLQLNVPDFSTGQSVCVATNTRPGRVVAVTEHSIVVHDLANPAGGFTDAEYQEFANRFDDVVYPVDVAAFGQPTDLDGNGRVIVFFTSEVNELTPPGSSGYVAGFFFAGDLFPRQANEGFQGCPTSNVAEIFYVFAPDPVRGGPFSKQNVQRGAIGTIAHEMEHLISASRRLHVLNAPLEDTWLDEGLAHMAEELVFYRVTGLGPRQNLTLQNLQQHADAANTYIVDNLVRYLLYLEEPDSNSLIGIDALPTRGASWAFLRYAADREPGPDQSLFFNLVNSSQRGVANLSARLNADAIDWMQDWTMSVYTDDAVPVDARYVQPSWNFRSIMPIFTASRRNFPLKVIGLGSDNAASVRLRGGGAAFFRFGIPESGRVGVRLSTPDADIPDELRVSIVRTR